MRVVAGIGPGILKEIFLGSLTFPNRLTSGQEE